METIELSKSNLDVLSSLKPSQPIHFKCLSCGKDVNLKFAFSQKSRYRELLCSTCHYRQTFLGNGHHYVPTKESPKEVDTNTDLSELSDHWWIHFKCTECGKDVLMRYHIRELRLMCKSCKTRSTNIEKYGCINVFQAEDVKQKTKKTNLERYGVEYISQNLEIQKKAEQTNLQRYGATHPQKSELIREKTRQTNMERYGGAAPLCNPGVKKKLKKTNLERYGTENVFQNKYIKEKSRQTMVERYGVEHNSQVPEFQERLRETLTEHYGMAHAPRKHSEYDGQWFDSSWEVTFYKYWKTVPGAVIIREPCVFQYIYDGKKHDYIPDFYLKKPDGTEGFYEVKGDHFFAMREGMEVMVCPYDHTLDDWSEAKHQCALEHGVIFVRKKDIEELERLS